jgi:chemotaxis protein methyltransferase CheR
MGISVPEFEYLRKLLRDNAAIVLDADKQYLAESRLAPLINREGFSSVQTMLAQMRVRPSGELHRKVLDAMTNNETWFFRDGDPFEALQTTLMAELLQKRERERKLTIWSAAASSGQEAYSVGMMIRERFPGLLAWNLEILATDISAQILQRAEQGRYSQLEVNRGLPIRLLTKYFEQRGIEWEISVAVRRMITFRLMNLAEPWVNIPQTDIMFLRNVMIYFDVETKRKILARAARILAPDGYLFLGCAETTLNLSDEFERVQCGKMFCYRLSTKKETR